MSRSSGFPSYRCRRLPAPAQHRRHVSLICLRLRTAQRVAVAPIRMVPNQRLQTVKQSRSRLAPPFFFFFTLTPLCPPRFALEARPPLPLFYNSPIPPPPPPPPPNFPPHRGGGRPPGLFINGKALVATGGLLLLLLLLYSCMLAAAAAAAAAAAGLLLLLLCWQITVHVAAILSRFCGDTQLGPVLYNTDWHGNA
eukprot:SAG25_NODE_888_length_4924_cov_17.004560_5_plen_196_part_00